MSENKDGEKTSNALTLEEELLAEFGENVEAYDFNEKEATDFLLAFWNIISTCARLGFEVGPYDAADGDNTDEKLADLRMDVVSLFHPIATAHETIAPRSSQDTKEQPCTQQPPK
ncbi:MAG: hypothetical protein AAFQ58_08230 [Pseudomonadota bacterium]